MRGREARALAMQLDQDDVAGAQAIRRAVYRRGRRQASRRRNRAHVGIAANAHDSDAVAAEYAKRRGPVIDEIDVGHRRSGDDAALILQQILM